MMTDKTEFDDIRPYTDDEIPAAMQRIAASSSFPLLATYVYPGEEIDDVRERIRGYRTIREFQSETMRRVNERIVQCTIDAFTCSGLDRLSPDRQYLYVSNHRDIMLDASLLEYYLVTHGFDTTEITFGANLMQGQLVIDIGKSNKITSATPSATSIRACGSHSATDAPRTAWTAPTRASSRCSA